MFTGVLVLSDSGMTHPIHLNGSTACGSIQVVLHIVPPSDKQGLPSPETLELLQGYTVLRTDRNRWIELSTGEEHMWV